MSERPDLAVLDYVNPARFGAHHLKLLERLAANTQFVRLNVVELVQRIAASDLWLFETRLDEHKQPPAIVLLSTLGLPPHTLMVEGLAGDGVLARKASIIEDVRRIAAYYGCERVQALTPREGFDKFAEGSGFMHVATMWEMEVQDGQGHPEGNHDNSEG